MGKAVFPRALAFSQGVQLALVGKDPVKRMQDLQGEWQILQRKKVTWRC